MRTWITPVSLLASITVTMMVLGLLRKDRVMRTWITPVSLLANITVTMMVLGLLRKDNCDAYLDHPCLIS